MVYVRVIWFINGGHQLGHGQFAQLSRVVGKHLECVIQRVVSFVREEKDIQKRTNVQL